MLSTVASSLTMVCQSPIETPVFKAYSSAIKVKTNILRSGAGHANAKSVFV